jgi:DNA invertase Pin-like site-specific DNA recombinase
MQPCTSAGDAERGQGAGAGAARRQCRTGAAPIAFRTLRRERPELFRLLSDCKPGDVLLVEQVDRLSRLSAEDWQRLKEAIGSKRVRVVALDLPTSWTMATGRVDDFTSRMFEAINAMMLDVLAAVARKDYEDRRRRQAEGIAKAKTTGAYRGRKEDTERNKAIISLLRKGVSWSIVMKSTGAARGTVGRHAPAHEHRRRGQARWRVQPPPKCGAPPRPAA